ncbi:MAG: NAD-dependent protein deacylase [Bacteroidales bacterium]|nr:NAD-dependent protein deacylase [Bacteroidales bacterium]MBQ8811963.1 NAD-dependent protein deacylase [Bacteroidales bacterium]
MPYRYETLPDLEKFPLRQHIVVLSGAGISVESGLATFRGDDDSVWSKFDWKRLASIGGFYEDPAVVLEFYNERRRQLLEVEPNHAHRLLAKLEKWHDVTIITQNIDNLHERAGSSKVLHLHGELSKVTSSECRTDPACIKELPLDVPIRIGDKAADGAQLRPYIVWFGEYVTEYEKAAQIIRDADIFVVIGTSLTVSPASELIRYPHKSIPKFIIDPNKPKNPYKDTYLDQFEHIILSAVTGVEVFIDRLIELQY